MRTDFELTDDEMKQVVGGITVTLDGSEVNAFVPGGGRRRQVRV